MKKYLPLVAIAILLAAGGILFSMHSKEIGQIATYPQFGISFNIPISWVATTTQMYGGGPLEHTYASPDFEVVYDQGTNDFFLERGSFVRVTKEDFAYDFAWPDRSIEGFKKFYTGTYNDSTGASLDTSFIAPETDAIVAMHFTSSFEGIPTVYGYESAVLKNGKVYLIEVNSTESLQTSSKVLGNLLSSLRFK